MLSPTEEPWPDKDRKRTRAKTCVVHGCSHDTARAERSEFGSKVGRLIRALSLRSPIDPVWDKGRTGAKTESTVGMSSSSLSVFGTVIECSAQCPVYIKYGTGTMGQFRDLQRNKQGLLMKMDELLELFSLSDSDWDKFNQVSRAGLSPYCVATAWVHSPW